MQIKFFTFKLFLILVGHKNVFNKPNLKKINFIEISTKIDYIYSCFFIRKNYNINDSLIFSLPQSSKMNPLK